MARATSTVREELIAVHATKACDRRAEAAGLLRSAGSLHLRPGGTFAFEAGHAHPGVARRIHEAITAVDLGHPDEPRLEQPGQGHPRARYVVHVEPVGRQRLAAAGILNADGLPDPHIPRALVAKACCAGAYLRGAFLARGSVSDPKSSPHLELRAESTEVAVGLSRLCERIGARAFVREHRGFAAVVKDHAGVVVALAAMGAHSASMLREDASIWKSLHSDANRLANADSGNARRHARAATAQLAAIAALEGVALPAALAEIAALRVEDPDASLSELAARCDPAITRGAAGDRLRRLIARADAETPAS
jgi:DNA-binding protein WhiA